MGQAQMAAASLCYYKGMMRAAQLPVYYAVVIPERDDSMSLSVSTEVIRQGPHLVDALIGQAQQVVIIKDH